MSLLPLRLVYYAEIVLLQLFVKLDANAHPIAIPLLHP